MTSGNKWIEKIFEAKIAKNGGIVRRKVESVDKFANLKDLKEAVRGKRFHMLRIGGQYLIICNTGDLKTIC